MSRTNYKTKIYQYKIHGEEYIIWNIICTIRIKNNITQNAKYLIQYTNYSIRNTKYKTQHPNYKLQNTIYQIQSTEYKIPKMKYDIQNTWIDYILIPLGHQSQADSHQAIKRRALCHQLTDFQQSYIQLEVGKPGSS